MPVQLCRGALGAHIECSEPEDKELRSKAEPEIGACPTGHQNLLEKPRIQNFWRTCNNGKGGLGGSRAWLLDSLLFWGGLGWF